MRDQVCEWELLSDEAPKAAQKRKYLDLEQRSASEHELLTYLRTLSEADSLRLTRRLREGYHIDELLNFARELSNISAGERGILAQRIAIEHRNRPLAAVPRSGHESESEPMAGEIASSARPRGPTLPPIASIWYTPLPVQQGHFAVRIESGVDFRSLGNHQNTRLGPLVQESHPMQICHHQIARETEKAVNNEREHPQ
jgi:hypothetical protein